MAPVSAHTRVVQRKDVPENFTFVKTPEPHAQRRKAILAKYPQIAQLYGPDWRSAVFCLATVAIQFIMACYIVPTYVNSPWVLFALCYVISGTLNHSLLLAMHEVTHDLFFENRTLNQIFAVIANLPMGVPASSLFKYYHAEHHSGQGKEGFDVDIPTVAEAKLFTTIPGRFLWVMLQPLFYGVRPMIIKPKELTPVMQAIAVFHIAFDIAIFWFFGWKASVYLLGGTVLGTGVHPMSGHFVAEHFEFVSGQETYSYYGPLNWITYNVGYHNEHHDFPRVSGWKLPLVKKIAPEFYDMPSYNSWSQVCRIFAIDLSH